MTALLSSTRLPHSLSLRCPYYSLSRHTLCMRRGKVVYQTARRQAKIKTDGSHGRCQK